MFLILLQIHTTDKIFLIFIFYLIFFAFFTIFFVFSTLVFFPILHVLSYILLLFIFPLLFFHLFSLIFKYLQWLFVYCYFSFCSSFFSFYSSRSNYFNYLYLYLKSNHLFDLNKILHHLPVNLSSFFSFFLNVILIFNDLCIDFLTRILYCKFYIHRLIFLHLEVLLPNQIHHFLFSLVFLFRIFPFLAIISLISLFTILALF